MAPWATASAPPGAEGLGVEGLGCLGFRTEGLGSRDLGVQGLGTVVAWDCLTLARGLTHRHSTAPF